MFQCPITPSRIKEVAQKFVKILLKPKNTELVAPRDTNLLQFLQSKDIPVGNACGGMGLCASCKVSVLKNEKNISRPNDQEMGLKDRNHLQKNERISCQCRVLGDIEITTNYW
ncbi:MAG: hypothetical protein JWQ35_780 [Bacteriovoracaceae bacterium]|nr:hypothetical protein [Bacteriovoracaceae bacterium]